MFKNLSDSLTLFFTKKRIGKTYLGTYDEPKGDEPLMSHRALGNVKLPIKINLFAKTQLWAEDQGKTGRCTAYALTMVKQIMDSMRNGRTINLDQERQWKFQAATGGTDERGDYLQNANKQMTLHPPTEIGTGKEFPLSEVRRIREKTAFAMKKFLARGYPIFTGVKIKRDGSADNFSWSRIRNGVVDLVRGFAIGGHSIAIVGYETVDDTEFFIGINSWGKSFGYFKNGTFLIRADQIERMMSMYIVYDLRDDV